MDQKTPKSGIQITGTVWAKNEYVNKDTGKVYHSIDMAVKGTRQMVNIKIPDGFDHSKIIEDTNMTFGVTFKVNNFNGKISPEFTIIS